MVRLHMDGVLNKSKTPTLGSGSLTSMVLGNSCLSKFCGRSLWFILAAPSKILMTSWVRPMANNQRGDSGNTHLQFYRINPR